MHRTALLAAAATLGAVRLAGAAPATATTYGMVGDFSIAANPNGAWSYLANGKRIKFPNATCFNAVHGFQCWTTEQPVPNSITVGRNVSKRVISYLTIMLPTDHLAFDPESGSVTVRWTAPADGTYTVAGDFVGIDTNEQSHPVRVLHGPKVLFSATIAAYTQHAPFRLSVAVRKGEHLDFTALTGASYSFLSTGIRASIQ